MNIRARLVCALVAIALFLVPHVIQAQPPALGGHYPAGIEGLNAATLPPPGIYARDYNYFYWSDHFKDGPKDFDAFAYINAIRAIWITDKKFLGADYGMDLIVPLVYQDVRVGGGPRDSHFGVGDVAFEPLLLSWHLDRFDFSAGYAFWAPSGEYDPHHPALAGKDFWSNMFTAGATWYMDADKTWSISALNRYEVHTEHEDLHVTPGDTYTLEWGLGKTFCKTITTGVAGYYQQQVNQDAGHGTSHILDSVVGIGPEISIAFPEQGIFLSARYAFEFDAQNRPEGNTACLTFTKKW